MQRAQYVPSANPWPTLATTPGQVFCTGELMIVPQFTCTVLDCLPDKPVYSRYLIHSRSLLRQAFGLCPCPPATDCFLGADLGMFPGSLLRHRLSCFRLLPRTPSQGLTLIYGW